MAPRKWSSGKEHADVKACSQPAVKRLDHHGTQMR